MRIFVYSLLSITMLNCLEKEELIKSPTGEIMYSAHYVNGWDTYAISFNIENPSNGTICNLEGSWLKDLTITIENNAVSHAFFKSANGPVTLSSAMIPPFLNMYNDIRKEFEVKKQNNTLPPLK